MTTEPAVKAATCSRCGGALMPDTIFCQACNATCPAALAEAQAFFAAPKPGTLIRVFAEALKVGEQFVSLDLETCPDAAFVRIVLERRFTLDDAVLLVRLREAQKEHQLVAGRLLHVQVFAEKEWREVLPLSTLDRRPALVMGAPLGGARIQLAGHNLAVEAGTVEEGLLAIRRAAPGPS